MHLQAGITFLSRQQQKDGSFLSLSSPDSKKLSKPHIFHSVFSTALILSSLTHLDRGNRKLDKLKSHTASFLLSQKSKFWTFNYWTRDSQEAKEMPYPDDLDDTFCALSALYEYDPKLITSTVLAKVVPLLTELEVKVGGPYRTWIVPPDAASVWQDVDVVVNANIAYFLHLQEVELPTLHTFFEEKMLSHALASPYYPSIYPIIYFFSRFYRGKHTKMLADILISKQKKGIWENPLNTALSLLSLRYLGSDLQNFRSAFAYLKNSQQQDGSWTAAPFYTGVNPNRDTLFYGGSAALTTVFCLEALSLSSLLTQKSVGTTLHKQESTEETMHQKVLDEAVRFAQPFDKKLTHYFLAMVRQLTKTDSGKQITLLAYYFFRSLSRENQRFISETFIIKLGLANLLGWIAYTIYDDFLDDEGDKPQLSVANVCLREVTTIFTTLFPQESEFYEQFKEIMIGIDTANLLEVITARFIPEEKVVIEKLKLPKWKQYDLLAKRSLGHALGPLAIMYQLKQEKSQQETLLHFFHHYIIAKQFNDDAHDFEDDFKKGLLTPVVTKLVNRYRQKQKISSHTISMKKLPMQLKELFWYEVLDDVATIIFFHLNEAKNSLTNLPLLEDKTVLEKLLFQLEIATKKALSERDQALEFIKVYRS